MQWAISTEFGTFDFQNPTTLGARGFLREETRSAISEARSGEERQNRQEARKPLFARDS